MDAKFVYKRLGSFFSQFQSLQVLPTTIQDSILSGAVMLVISLLMIPDPISSIWVMIAIVSIETGVLGYMTMWDVKLDPVSMISCLLCIGFAVEFATHVSHSYVSSSQPTKELKIREALDHIGGPIVHG